MLNLLESHLTSLSYFTSENLTRACKTPPSRAGPSAPGSVSSLPVATPPQPSSSSPLETIPNLHRQPPIPEPGMPSHLLHHMTRNTLFPPLPSGPRLWRNQRWLFFTKMLHWTHPSLSCPALLSGWTRGHLSQPLATTTNQDQAGDSRA